MSGPKFVRYFGPVLRALEKLGGSGRPAEVCDYVAEELNLSEEELGEKLKSGQLRFYNQVAWARFILAKGEYIDSSQTGVWTITDKGRSGLGMSAKEAISISREIQSKMKKTGDEIEVSEIEGSNNNGITPGLNLKSDYRSQIQSILMSLPPNGFERFCQRLLREAGFEHVNVTGRSGDGGIDGVGILQVNPLVSFKVLFQCKRYAGSIVPSQVRDFRGAMGGRADKGIIITTGSFTSEAKKESVRDGVPPIELVDGEKLIEMCVSLQIGLKKINTYEIDNIFFQDYSK